KIITFDVFNIKLIHDLYNPGSHLTCTSNSYLYVRQVHILVLTNHFIKVEALMRRFQIKLLKLLTIGQQAVMRTNRTGKEAETENTLTIAVCKAFIVYHSDAFGYHCLHQLLVVGLFLLGVRKE